LTRLLVWCDRPYPMTQKDARSRFGEAIAKDSKELAAGKLGCSVTQVIGIAKGERSPGLRIAAAIEEVYGIAMGDWLERPVSRKP
jgi:transcriptional regulator with XRE-family HTH domain